MRSLRIRLFLVAAGAIVAALVAVALLSRQAARTEFRRYELSGQAARVEGVGSAPPVRLNAILENLGRAEHRDLLLISADGDRIVGASREELRGATVHLGTGGLF